ncbi:MAG: hypothetical protein AAF998_09800 [Bacteroidota bacterium]
MLRNTLTILVMWAGLHCGGLAQTLLQNVPAPNGTVEVVRFLGGGDTLLIGGTFTMVGDSARSNFAALHIPSNTVLGGTPAVNGRVREIALGHDRIYLGGQFSQLGDSSRNSIGAITAAGEVLPWNPDAGGNGDVRTILPDVATVYIGGTFATLGGLIRSNLAEVDTATGAATAFAPEPTGSVNDLLAWGDTIIIGGNYFQVAGVNRAKIAAVDRMGNLYPWNPGATSFAFSFVWKMITHDGKLYIGGIFQVVDNQPRSCFAAFAMNTLSLQSVAPNPDSYVLALATYADTLWAGGFFSTFNAQPLPNLGGLETTTGMAVFPPANPNGTVEEIDSRCNRIAIGGDFTQLGTDSVPFLAVFEYPADSLFLGLPQGDTIPLNDSLLLVAPGGWEAISWYRDGMEVLAWAGRDSVWALDSGFYWAIGRSTAGCRQYSFPEYIFAAQDNPTSVIGSPFGETGRLRFLRGHGPGLEAHWELPRDYTATAITVWDLSGRVVQHRALPPENRGTTRLRLSPGLYLVQLHTNVESFILVRRCFSVSGGY